LTTFEIVNLVLLVLFVSAIAVRKWREHHDK
jgi:hypothetical protein